VSWTAGSPIAGPPNFQILARSYSYAGAALGSPFVVRSGSSGTDIDQEIGMDPAGNFTVAWSALDGGTWDAYARRFVRDGATILPTANGQSITGISGSSFWWAPQGTIGEFRYYKVTIPAGTTRMQVSISGGAGSGDADLYVRYGLLPSTSAWNARPYLEGSNESILATNPSPGDWYIGVHAYSSFSGVTLSVSYP
jgi:serine protease